jgi:hypothetical protein
MVFSPGLFLKVKTSIFKAGFRLETVLSPVPGYDLPCGGSNGKSVSVDIPPRGCHGYPVASVWLSRVLPQDPHSDQEVRSCSTYIHKISRVWNSYLAVQRLNRYDGKDINEPRILWPECLFCLNPGNPFTHLPAGSDRIPVRTFHRTADDIPRQARI